MPNRLSPATLVEASGAPSGAASGETRIPKVQHTLPAAVHAAAPAPTRAEVLVPTPPTPAAPVAPTPPNWVAIIALAVSLLTMLKSFWTEYVSAKTQRKSEFEADFGSTLVQALRTFEGELKTLRTFTLDDPRDLDVLRADFGKNFVGWNDANFAVTTLLEEIDGAVPNPTPGWAEEFQQYVQRAEDHLNRATDPLAVATPADFKQAATSAYREYRQGVTAVRANLARYRETLKPNFRKWLRSLTRC